MNEHDSLFLLSEDDRATVITAARHLTRKLQLPPEAHEEVMELVRQCGAVIAEQERKRKKREEAGVDLEAMTKSIFRLPSALGNMDFVDQFLSGTNNDFTIESNSSTDSYTTGGHN